MTIRRPSAVTAIAAPGKYSYEIDRGPEYGLQTGSFMLQKKATEKLSVSLERLVDLAAEGWWSGDLHVHRPVRDIELLMRAEDLHIAPVITWWNNRNPWASLKEIGDPTPSVCFPTEADCAAYLLSRLQRKECGCPRCGARQGYWLGSRQRWQCAGCHLALQTMRVAVHLRRRPRCPNRECRLASQSARG